MLQMKKDLDQRFREGNPLRIGVVGTGKMGGALLSQLRALPGIRPAVVVNRTPQRALDALMRAGYESDSYKMAEGRKKALAAYEQGKIIVTDDYHLALSLPLEGIVDATGNPSLGAELAVATIDAHMDIVMLNVETDAVVGSILLEKAKKQGVIYTGSAGDEPGAIMELCATVLGNGFRLLAVGKGKNNPLNRYATKAQLAEEAEMKGLRPEMLVGFVDGTNTMIEMTAAGNALGFVPDVPGLYGRRLSVADMPAFYRTKDDGGELNRYGIVDYSFGIAPGVYAIATTDSPDVKEIMRYVSMGKGPNYVFHRPFHLTSLETPTSIYKAIVCKEPTVAPEAGQFCDTVAVAKRDIKKGEAISGIGSDDVYGTIVTHASQQEDKLLPIALITPGTIAATDIRKGEAMTGFHVEHTEPMLIHKLREEQDQSIFTR